jgi:urease accessory protein
LVRLRSEAPLMLRPAPGPVVHLVGGAAGPLGGDTLALDVVVGAGAHLVVRGVAATLALPGADGEPARLKVRATLGPGACLDWAPEPTIVAHRAHLELDTEIEVETPSAGTLLRWREELVLGRAGEPPGQVTARTRVVVGGRPVLDHATTAGGPPGPWDGPGGLAGHRWLGTALHVGRSAGGAPRSPDARPGAGAQVRAATLCLADGSWLSAATAVDRQAGLRIWGRPPVT